MNYSEPLLNGFFVIDTIANPAAATDWSRLLPNGNTYEILMIRYTFVADANAANRFFRLQFSFAGNNLITIASPTALTAGLTGTICYAQGFGGHSSPINQQWITPLPIRLTVPGNTTFNSAIQNMQVGDQVSDIDICWRQWVNQTV